MGNIGSHVDLTSGGLRHQAVPLGSGRDEGNLGHPQRNAAGDLSEASLGQCTKSLPICSEYCAYSGSAATRQVRMAVRGSRRMWFA
jgi:hypothetical protein